MNLNLVNAARAAPKSSKLPDNQTAVRETTSTVNNDSRQTSDDEKSFQNSLDTKLKVCRENKKAIEVQQKASEDAAVSSIPVTITIQEAQEQIAFAMEVTKMLADTDQANSAQQALEQLSQALQQLQQTDPETEVSVTELMKQINAAVNQNQTDEDEVKIEYQVDLKTSLDLLAQQETGNKAAAGLEIALFNVEQIVKEDDQVVEEIVVQVDQSEDKSADTDVTFTQMLSAKSASSEQISPLQNKTEEASVTDILNQINDKIKTTLESGKDVIKIQLQPENLGKVEVRIVRGSDGIQFYFSSDNINTTRMMQATINQLQQTLTDAGVKVGNMSVSYQGQPGQQNNQGQQSQRKSGSFFGLEDTSFFSEFSPQGGLSALDARA